MVAGPFVASPFISFATSHLFCHQPALYYNLHTGLIPLIRQMSAKIE
jgi:hypothetical protein